MKIIATGSALPHLELTNYDLSQYVDTNDEWIYSRTGIKSRRVISTETITGLAVNAAKNCIESSGVSVDEIDYILCHNVIYDAITPSLACFVMHGIQASCPTLDLNAACTGFLYALDMADGLLRSGKAKKILIVCAEQPSKFVNWQERDTCILFGDAAGAVIVSNEGDDALFNIGTRYIGALYCPTSYGNSPFCKHDKEDKPFLQMKGKEVFKAAVQYCTSDIKTILEKSGKTVDEIDYFLLHQANMRILETIRTNIGIPEEKLPHNLERTGNTSSASVPVLLDEMNKKGKLKDGDTLIFSTFGSGFTSGACIIKW